jgi:hypothetical protein
MHRHTATRRIRMRRTPILTRSALSPLNALSHSARLTDADAMPLRGLIDRRRLSLSTLRPLVREMRCWDPLMKRAKFTPRG